MFYKGHLIGTYQAFEKNEGTQHMEYSKYKGQIKDKWIFSVQDLFRNQHNLNHHMENLQYQYKFDPNPLIRLEK